ncbi:MAG: coenzyme F420-0:L-glutamate ligase [Nakamurella sp.]
MTTTPLHHDEPASPLAPAPSGLTILPVHGMPDIRPNDDLAQLIWSAAANDICDGDVLVVTSKIVSKAEGRLLKAPTNHAERDAFRRRVIDGQTVRLVAQIGRTKIVENRLGLVGAAAGVDASNVHADEIALLPMNPDATAAAMVTAFAERGHRVGVVITDTQGRAWRNGVTDVAIGAAGFTVLDDQRGGIDEFGNELVVTQVAVGDELAAAADLVKGKLSRVPVAIVRGLDAPGLSSDKAAENAGAPSTTGGGATLIREAATDLFRLGTDLAIELGRHDALGGTTDGHRALGADARSLLQSWSAPSHSQRALKQAFLTLIAARPDATARSCVPGHLTASTIVLSADLRHILLTLHPRVGLWVQLGGHCEDHDETIAAAAAREAREESGIDTLDFDVVPIALDIHPITCSLGVATRHFDVRFVAIAPDGTIPVRSHESKDLRFWPVDALPEGAEADGLTEAVRLAVRRAGSTRANHATERG